MSPSRGRGRSPRPVDLRGRPGTFRLAGASVGRQVAPPSDKAKGRPWGEVGRPFRNGLARGWARSRYAVSRRFRGDEPCSATEVTVVRDPPGAAVSIGRPNRGNSPYQTQELSTGSRARR